MIIKSTEMKQRYLQRMAGVRDNKVYIGPEIVTLEIINVCNLSCHYCSASHAPGNPAHFEKARFFEWDDFLGIVRDSVEMKVDHIYIAGPGEPTRHPLFQNMMRHLEEKPLYVKLFTNATFPLDYCTDVIKADHIVINLSAVDPQGYQTLFGKDLFDRVISNIKQLVSLRDTIKPKFRIEIVYIVNTINVNHKKEMQCLADQLGVNGVNFVDMQVNAYNQDIAFPEGVIDGEKRRTPSACLNGWFYMAIKLHDSVSVCCKIHKMPFGDFDKGSFKQFWFSQRMMNLRLLGKYGKIQKMFKACETCPDYDKNIRRSEDLKKALLPQAHQVRSAANKKLSKII